MTINYHREDLLQREDAGLAASNAIAVLPSGGATMLGGKNARDSRVATQALGQFLDADAEQVAALLRAAGNPRRLLVLCLLMEHGELSVGSLLEHLDLSQSALSQHLARMREEGLVTFRRASQTLYYRIGDDRVKQLIVALKDIYRPQVVCES